MNNAAEDEIYWQLNEHPIMSNNHVNISNCQINSQLKVSVMETSGRYTIFVGNSYGDSSMTFQVTVTSK